MKSVNKSEVEKVELPRRSSKLPKVQRPPVKSSLGTKKIREAVEFVIRERIARERLAQSK